MALSVIISARARNDLAEAADYMHQQSPQAARNMRHAILEALDLLEKYPRMGRVRPDLSKKEDVFFWPVVDFMITYRISNSRLQVLRFVRQSRDIRKII